MHLLCMPVRSEIWRVKRVEGTEVPEARSIVVFVL